MAMEGPNVSPVGAAPLGAIPKKPLWKKWWFWLVAGLVLLFVLVGISSGGGSTDEAEPAPEVDPMPSVLGERLDVALSDLEAFGVSEGDIEIVGGGAFGILDESNWTVCEQRPEPGSIDLVDFRLVVDRTCPDTDAGEGSVEQEVAEESADDAAADADPAEGVESEETAAAEPDSPATFIPAARRDLRDLRKDVNDLETAIAEGGVLRVAGNQVELAFNLGQLGSLNPPEEYAAEWNAQLDAVSSQIDAMNVLIDEDGTPGQVADAIDAARTAINAALDSVNEYESSLG